MKLTKHFLNISNQVFFFAFVLAVSSAYASDSNIHPRYKVKDGLAVYLGLIPAEMIEGHYAKSMHGGAPMGQYRYHLAIAIFDDKTGERIKNSKVEIRISSRDGVGMETSNKLEDMTMNGKHMYGNYFSLKTTGPYRVDVNIKFGGDRKPINLVFNYDFAHT